MAQIYLDCDGVLADFDKGAEAVLGMLPELYEAQHGSRAFWRKLAAAPDFFAQLELMPDAMQLYQAVQPLRPIILTGMPHGAWAEPQKRRWAERYFPGVPIITTMAALKHEHCHPGDVLVDDRDKHRHLWECAGGIFVHHQNAETSLTELRRAGFAV